MNNLKEDFKIKILIKKQSLVSNISCLYFLINDEEIVYIGQSKNLTSRIKQHKNDKKFNSFSFIEFKENLNEEEAFFILLFNPIYNRAIPQNNKYLLLNEKQNGIIGYENVGCQFDVLSNFNILSICKKHKIECFEFKYKKQFFINIEQFKIIYEKFYKEIDNKIFNIPYNCLEEHKIDVYKIPYWGFNI